MLLVFDPGFHDLFAHHSKVNRLLAEAAGDSGVRVFANADLHPEQAVKTPELTVQPYFHGPAYASGHDECDDDTFDRTARAFAEDCVGLLNQYPGQRILLHTGLSYHVAGLAQAISTTATPPASVKISLMFPPFLRRPSGQAVGCIAHPKAWGRYANSLGWMSDLARDRAFPLSLGTPNAEFVKEAELGLGIHVVDHGPMTRTSLKERRVGETPRILAFAGAPKQDRGVDLAVAALEMGLEADLPVQWLIHLNLDFSGAQEHLQRLAEVADRLSDVPNVELHLGPLESEQYETLVRSSDIAWVLLDPHAYSDKTSGLVWDLLSSGTDRFVSAKGSYPQRELDQTDVEQVTITDFEPALLLKATKKVLSLPSPGREARSSVAGFHRWALKMPDHPPQSGNEPAREGVDVRQGRPARTSVRGSSKPRVLVVRSVHAHLTGGAGPIEFVPYLVEQGLSVKVVDFPLVGEKSESQAGLARRLGLESEWRWSVRELNLLTTASDYEVVHFVDGEHAGPLVASWPRLNKVVATLHQPASILAKVIPARQLDRFDAIHAISPDQRDYLQQVSQAPVVLVPHGQRERWGASKVQDGPNAVPIGPTVLTVGAWLRDPQAWLSTARAMADQGVNFVWIGPPSEVLEGSDLPRNVYFSDVSITSAELADWYQSSTVVFLPLADATANNCLLEARSLGRPVVVTDLPSTRFYSGGAIHVLPSVDGYVQGLRSILNCEQADGLGVSHGAEFQWRHIATRMREEVYGL